MLDFQNQEGGYSLWGQVGCMAAAKVIVTISGGTGNCFDLGASYFGVFSLWKLLACKLYTSLCVYYTSIIIVS